MCHTARNTKGNHIQWYTHKYGDSGGVSRLTKLRGQITKFQYIIWHIIANLNV